MDISKLPRLSQTSAASPAPATDDPPRPAAAPDQVAAPAAVWCGRCNAPNTAGSQFCNSCGAPLRPSVGYASAVEPGVGAEVWLSAVIGVVLMVMGMTFARWALTTLTGGTFHTNVNWMSGPNAGQEVGYWQLQGHTALQDAGLFLFGLAMVLEAVVLVGVYSRLRAKVPLLVFALAITMLATALNLLVVIRVLADDLIPLTSLLAVGFGGYIAVYEWRLLQHFRTSVAQRA